MAQFCYFSNVQLPRYTESIETRPSFPTHCFTPRPGYLPGERVEGFVCEPDGTPLGKRAYICGHSPGSGFAGQVYAAASAEGPAGLVALKVLHPRSAWKSAAREWLFWLTFQARFPPRWNEAAVRSGLLWQELIRRAAADAGLPVTVSRPIGYFWDAQLASFVEIHEWIDSRETRFAPNDSLLRPDPEVDPPDEMHIKKQAMDKLVGLCRAMGAEGIARQFMWYTFVSQANVLTRQAGTETPALCAVDCRPGLAFPFFLSFTPTHLAINLSGLARGQLAHYAENDLAQLEDYLANRLAPGRETARLVQALRREETLWRASLPDLWHTRTRLLREPAFRATVRAALVDSWASSGDVDELTAAHWKSGPGFSRAGLLSLLPFPGGRLLRLAGSSAYRAHCMGLLRAPAYRAAALHAWRARDLPEWKAANRCGAAHAARLAQSIPAYALEKMALAWLPAPLQRACTDQASARRLADELFIQPLRLLFSRAARCVWLETILRAEIERGAASANRASSLLAQVYEPRLNSYLRDLGWLFAFDLASRLVYLALAGYGLKTHNFWPLGLALLSPIPPSGLLRAGYLLIRLLLDLPSLAHLGAHPGHPLERLVLARVAALLVAPLRFVGNLFPLIELSTVYPRMAFILAAHFASAAVNRIPIFGGRGKLLEYWAFTACFNLPLSLQREWLIRFARK